MSIKALVASIEQQHIDLRSALISLTSNTLGSLAGAVGLLLFMIPSDIVPGGVSGVTVILNELFGLPLGLMNLLINIPILYLGYKTLPGGWKMISGTIYAVVVYAVAIDMLAPVFAGLQLSDDRLLNTLFGGILMGISGGLVFRTGATFGSTSVIALILQRKTGLSMTNTIMIADIAIIGAAGLVFGWEASMYALVVLFISGIATDYVLEGPSVIRTVTIVTSKPHDVANAVMSQMARGVTRWDGQGMYSGMPRSVLFVTVSRAQVNEIKQLAVDIDPNAFVVIGQGHTAYGGGFRPVKPSRVPRLYREEPAAVQPEAHSMPPALYPLPQPLYTHTEVDDNTDVDTSGLVAPQQV